MPRSTVVGSLAAMRASALACLVLLAASLADGAAHADEPALPPAPFLNRSDIDLGMGVEVHGQQPLPLDWAVGGETVESPLISAEIDGFVTNGSRFRNRVDYISLVGGVALHPLYWTARGDGASYVARFASLLAVDLGVSLETAHVGTQFHYAPGLSIGLHLDAPLTADGGVVARLEVRHFFAPSVRFTGELGTTETYGPPPAETFFGLVFRL